MKSRRDFSFFISIYFLLSFNVLAGGKTTCLLRALSAVVAPKVDSSVELELNMSKQVLQLLTTTNGKIGGILKTRESLPDWVNTWAKESFPKSKVKDIEWDMLGPEKQMSLIRDLSSKRKQDFFEDRRLHGMVSRKQVWVTFEEPTEFMGKSYANGRHFLDITNILGKVEYKGPGSVENGNGVELHFRTNKSSGIVSNDAWTLLKGLNIPRTHQHVHIVAPLPIEAMKAEPRLLPAMMGDFFRRSNLAAEMVSVIHDNSGVRPNIVRDIVYFDSLSPQRLKGVTRYFENVAKGKMSEIGDEFKMGWVGMRGADKYDTPGLWGIEYRDIGKTSDPVLVRNILDSLQYRMTNYSYGIPSDRIIEWMKVRSKKVQSNKSVSGLVSDSWYNQSWNQLLKNAPAKVLKKLGPQEIRKLRKIENREVKMLVFDWVRDPLFFDQPKLCKIIESEQVKALDRFFKGEPINNLMSDFLVDSGLYGIVMKSLGIEVKTKQSSL